MELGGISGYVSGSGKVEYSINMGDIFGKNYVGGICGNVVNGKIEYSGNEGIISGNRCVAGISRWNSCRFLG